MSWALFHEIRFISTYLYPFLVRSPMDGELLGLEWGMILQVSDIIFPDEKFRRQMSIFQRVG